MLSIRDGSRIKSDPVIRNDNHDIGLIPFDGDGNLLGFGFPQRLARAKYPISITAADFDVDGSADVAAADVDAVELPAFFSAFSGELFADVSAAAVPEPLHDALL